MATGTDKKLFEIYSIYRRGWRQADLAEHKQFYAISSNLINFALLLLNFTGNNNILNY